MAINIESSVIQESLQEVEKGLFEAALYNHLVSLSEGELTSATVPDQMVAVCGAQPNFPNTKTPQQTPLLQMPLWPCTQLDAIKASGSGLCTPASAINSSGLRLQLEAGFCFPTQSVACGARRAQVSH